MLTVQLDSPVPLADQLVAGLRGAIARGEVDPGARLPTVRQLAADLGIHMNTVARAYRELESQGLVSTVRGRGTVVTARTARAGRATDPAEVAARVAAALADARLAGLSRRQTERLVNEALDDLWPARTDKPRTQKARTQKARTQKARTQKAGRRAAARKETR